MIEPLVAADGQPLMTRSAYGYGDRVMRIVTTAGLLLAGFTAPAFAQSAQTPPVAQRVDRLEREMRAVQRKVFPGGSQQYFEAEIAPPQATGPAPGTPVGSPVADLTARVDTLEGNARLTGQAEQNASSSARSRNRSTVSRAIPSSG